jgi:hypothetical protein
MLTPNASRPLYHFSAYHFSAGRPSQSAQKSRTGFREMQRVGKWENHNVFGIRVVSMDHVRACEVITLAAATADGY